MDHLGSVDALTDASGAVHEHRSYDPFGQRRNPVWGQPTPASFPASTTVGFTGQESDDELGLLNFKGKIYDAAGRCIADTWHATLAEAKAQAQFEFASEFGDWVEVTN